MKTPPPRIKRALIAAALIASGCVCLAQLAPPPGPSEPIPPTIIAPAAIAPGVKVSKEQNVSVVRVNVTNQPYDFFQPWSKRTPNSRRAIGAVLGNKRILVTAEMIANATFVEIEKAESGEKMAAEVEKVDYEANLALLKPADEKFLTGLKPLEIRDVQAGDRVAVWQLESTGALLITPSTITTVDVSPYPVADIALLAYHLTAPLQYRDGSFTVPIVSENRLAGMMMRYDPRNQNIDVIPAPVIEHFLKEAARPEYRGFPRAGLLFSSLRDPQLRRYAGLKSDATGGVYVTDVVSGGPADRAGIKPGDVLVSVADQTIDQDGNYHDKLYGKISLVHLISTKTYDGEKTKFKLMRAGEPLTVDVTVAHRSPESYVIEPYVIGKAPRYYVLGGLVLQELSRQYLKEWGDWQTKAPERLVYYDRYQGELFANDPREKIVILSQVLPSPTTVGYDSLGYAVVEKINDVPLKSLADVAGAVAKPLNGFQKIELEEDPGVIYLDAQQVAEQEPELMKNYGLPATSNLE